MQHFLKVGANWVLFLSDDSLDATLQKHIVNVGSPLNTAKTKKIIKMGPLFMKHPLYYWSLILHAFMEKSAVYEKYLPLSQLGFVSLIMSVSKKLSLITTVLIKCIEKFHFRKKTFFSSFSWEIEERCLWHFCRADETLS